MSTLLLRVVRADDLLDLQFELVNLALDPDEATSPRRLVRVSPDREARIIVHFAPQHIAERTFSIERDTGELIGVPGPERDVPTRLAGASRLAFRLRPGIESLPLTLDALLDWSRFEPLLAANAIGAGGPQPPGPHETAIELPFRLMLSPDQTGRWTHRRTPAVRDGAVSLWQTWLGPAPRSLRSRPDEPVPVRAIFAAAGRNPMVLSLSQQNRAEIAALSSDATLLDRSRFHEEELTEEDLATLEALAPHLVQSIPVHHLTLSALGGSLRLSTVFDFPPLGNSLLRKRIGFEPATGDHLFALKEWSHAISVGRDQLVRVVQRGSLFPWGHRCDLVLNVERRIRTGSPLTGDERAAYLVREESLVLQELEREYSGRHDLPFTRIRMTRRDTPTLAPHPESGRFVPSVGLSPYAFPVIATDRVGQEIALGLPAIFVPDGDPTDPREIAEEYRTRPDLAHIRVGSHVAFAPADAVPEAGLPGPTTLLVDTIELDTREIPGAQVAFQPMLHRATVTLPAIAKIGGGAAATAIRYHDLYARGGFAGTGNGVFALLEEKLPLAFAAEKGGGIASPGFALTGLSRDLGAITNAAAAADPGAGLGAGQVIDGLGDATLLGVIPLALLIKAATQIAELPAVVTRAIAGGQEIRFDWRPTIPEAPPTGPDPLPAPLRRNPSGRLALDLHASLFTPTRLGDAPRTEVQGTLQHVAIGFADVLELRFQRIAFKTVTGQRPEFTVDLKGLTFTGALTFVDKLKEALQKFLGSGLFVNLAPDHLEAGLRVAIPDAPLFGFSVQNIAFSASVLLFLSKQPAAVKFGLCRRDNPFLITYSAFGGGGYFELTANTRGDISVDAGLDFGAVVSLNLFVAKGRAQALAGVGFSLTNTREGNKVELRASLRLSGSLEVLGLVTIAVQFYLELKYDFETKIATGRAAVTVMVRVLAFSKSVTLTVERSFNAREVPLPTPTRTFRETVSLAQWREYCEAFA